MSKMYLYIGIGVAVLVTVFVAMYIFRPTSTVEPVQGTPNFGTGGDRPSVGDMPTVPEVPAVSSTGSSASSKIFKLLEGPVAGVFIIEYGRPTTTVARFVMADSGRVFDLPLDVPGAVPRSVSGTTIPGIANTVWTAGDRAAGTMGDGVLVQYEVSGVIKTAHVAFPPATTTLGTQSPVVVKFLPDGITSIDSSPDGKAVSYVLRESAGAGIYRAAPDGTSSRKLLSLPLSQLSLTWPAAGTVLAQSAPSTGVQGVVYSINAQTGTAEPVLYAEGITATADSSFGSVVYQTASASARATYVRNIKTGLSRALSFDPFPTRCVWSPNTAAGMYCATPLTYVPSNYLESWYAGIASAADSIFAFNTATGQTTIVAAPGSSDGGEQADIAQFAVSQSENYLVYVRKGDGSLWAVRLKQ